MRDEEGQQLAETQEYRGKRARAFSHTVDDVRRSAESTRGAPRESSGEVTTPNFLPRERHSLGSRSLESRV